MSRRLKGRPQKARSEHSSAYRILVVDNDWEACGEILQCAKAQRFQVDWVQHPRDIDGRKGLMPYHVVFVPLDLFGHPYLQKRLPKENDGAGLPRIIVSRPAGDAGAWPDLPPGVHGWVEKPYDITVIEHRLLAVLNDFETLHRFEEELDRLEATRSRLMRQQQGLEAVHERLSEARKALSILMERMEMERQEATVSIMGKIWAMVLPITTKMRQDRQTEPMGTELEGLVQCALKGIVDPFSIQSKMIADLSPTELRIAVLIQRGLDGEGMARHLGIRASTLQTHRKNIRKKLGIRGRVYSLKNSLNGRRPPKRAN